MYNAAALSTAEYCRAVEQKDTGSPSEMFVDTIKEQCVTNPQRATRR